jgi:hypothetical protein
MRLGVLALLFASGCSLVQSLPSSNTPKHQRDTFYAVMGTFVVMATAAALIAGAPSEQPAMPRPSPELPPLGR